MTKRILLSALCLLLPITLIFADPLTIKAAAIKLETPKAWKISTSAGITSVVSTDKKALIKIMVLDAADLEASVQKALELIEEEIANAEFTEALKAKVNSMQYQYADGSGTNQNGTQVTLKYGVLMAKKPVFIYSVSLPGAEKYQRDIDICFKSFKKL